MTIVNNSKPVEESDPTRRRRTAYWVITLLLLYLTFEGAALLGLIGLRAVRGVEYKPILTKTLYPADRELLSSLLAGNTRLLDYSPELGWTIKANGSTGLYRANSSGIRANGEYEQHAPEGRVRIATFGDSFTFGWQVANADTWQEQAVMRDPRLELLNFGVMGYGLDQAYLRYLGEGKSFSAHIVLIGFMPHDITRHVNVFRPFHTPAPGLPLAKPRFELRRGRRELLENPMQPLSKYEELLERPEEVLRQLGRRDYFYDLRYRRGAFDFLPSVRLLKMCWYRVRKRFSDEIIRGGQYRESSEAYRITTAIFDGFVEEVVQTGSQPLIVLLPNRLDVEAYRAAGRRLYDPLLHYFDEEGYRYVDMMGALAGPDAPENLDELYFDHYTPLANRLVAERLLEYLTESGLQGSGDLPSHARF